MPAQTRKSKALEPAVDKNVYRRGKYSFQVKMMVGGHKITQICNSLEEARAFRDSKRVAKSLDPDFKRVLESRVKKSEAVSYTLDKLLDKYKREVTPSKKSATSEAYRIGKISRNDIAKLSIYTLTPDDVQGFLDKLADEGVSESGRRKYCALLSHMFNTAARRWRLKVTNPITAMELPAASKARDRRLEQNEAQRILKALDKDNPIAAAYVRLAIETAMRRGELLSLTWENVNLRTRVADLPETKNGEARRVPLSSGAVKVLRSLPHRKTGRVLPISVPALRGAWDRAKKEAGIEDLRIHDLRHEATSRLFEKGVFDSMEVASITGHKTLQMLKRYTHLRAEDLAKKMG